MGSGKERIRYIRSKYQRWVEQLRGKPKSPPILPFFKPATPGRCSGCNSINFDDLWGNPSVEEHDISDSDGEQHVAEGYFKLLRRSENCDICAILLPDYEPGECAMLSALLFNSNSRWHSMSIELDVTLSVQLKIVRLDHREGTHEDTEHIFFAPPQYLESGPEFLKPQILREVPDYDESRAWLENCRTYHGPGCNHDIPPTIDGMRLFDCQSARVVPADSVNNPRWIALSYVWGDRSHAAPIELSDDHQPSHLPQTVEDAIKVTQELGYRYLWIDELCIDQKNIAHGDSQLKMMDQIYEGADLTIVAAAGHDKAYGLPGVGTTGRTKCPVLRINEGVIFSLGPEPNKQVTKESTWSTRAWTFQEVVFSRRLLVFTDHQMTFYCRKASWMEALGGPRFMLRQDIDWESWPIRLSLWDPVTTFGSTSIILSTVSNFTLLIEDYTRRDLSYEADALKAVSGVLTRLREAEDPVFSLSGLPYYLDGERNTGFELIQRPEEVLGIALAWYNYNKPHKRQLQRRYMFPSWSWAGWTGPVGWLYYQNTVIPTKLTSHIRSVQMLNKAGEDVQHNLNFTQLQEALDSVTVLVLEALMIPPELFLPKYMSKDGAEDFVYEITIADRATSRGEFFRPSLLDNFVSNVRSGVWSCFYISELLVPPSTTRFILIVQWENEDTATRVGGFVIGRLVLKDEEDSLRPFESLLELRTVRLI